MLGKGRRSSKGPDQEGPQISEEDRKRIATATRQVVAYTGFLRWASNFRRDEIRHHPRHHRVMLLSPMQSGRFAFGVDREDLVLGTQSFEKVWLSALPLSFACVSDRLYLAVDQVHCMDAKLPALAIGIYVDDKAKLSLMSQASRLVIREIEVDRGEVTGHDDSVTAPVPLHKVDIVDKLAAQAKQTRNQQDLSRFM